MNERILFQELQEKTIGIQKYDEEIYRRIKAKWDGIAKPLDGMGVFEGLTAQIGAIQGQVQFDVEHAAVLVLCADNGVVAEGISQSDQSVTAICAENIAAGKSAVGMMARACGADVLAVDVGINQKEPVCGLHYARVADGTKNFAVMPAMTKEEAIAAIQTGMDLVRKCRQDGYRVLCVGEMGIGNTTTSAAVAAALLEYPAHAVTGRGAGLSDDKLAHKIQVIERALARYALPKEETLSILAALGGLDIAALAGVMLGGALYQLPIILDGVISMVAALIAGRLAPGCEDYMLPSHMSREPAALRIAEELKLRPVIDGDMALGEGTGAVMMLGLLQMAGKVYGESCSFDDAGVEQYVRYE